MARLTYKQRERMPSKDFAEPKKRHGGRGGYPIKDKAHARAALADVRKDGSPQEIRKIEREVHERFPGIKIRGYNARVRRPSTGRHRTAARHRRTSRSRR